MNVVSLLHDHLDHEPAVELVVLFGSHARGRARRDSDLDLGIAWSAGTGRLSRNAVLDRIERATRATVDMIDLDEAPPLLRMEIARTGKVIVARSPESWPDFCAHAMLDWWDFAPYARIMHEAARERLERAIHGPR
jgi:uncharacterized protein